MQDDSVRTTTGRDAILLSWTETRNERDARGTREHSICTHVSCHLLSSSQYGDHHFPPWDTFKMGTGRYKESCQTCTHWGCPRQMRKRGVCTLRLWAHFSRLGCWHVVAISHPASCGGGVSFLVAKLTWLTVQLPERNEFICSAQCAVGCLKTSIHL